jgi:hypothetical protein
VRGLLSDGEATAQLKFVKRFEKRVVGGDRNKTLHYALVNQPRVILSADVNGLCCCCCCYSSLYVFAVNPQLCTHS